MAEQQHSIVKKMDVVFEEVFQNANELPPDPNAREKEFPFPGIQGFSIGHGGAS